MKSNWISASRDRYINLNFIEMIMIYFHTIDCVYIVKAFTPSGFEYDINEYETIKEAQAWIKDNIGV